MSKFTERYASDPAFREAQKARQRALRSDPDFIATEKAYRRRPGVREKRTKASLEYVKREAVKKMRVGWSATSRKKPEAIARARARGRLKKGFTQQLYDDLFLIQAGLCAVCRNPLSVSAHADHCHDTQKPRGILCRTCNTVEGHIKKLKLSPSEFGTRLQSYLDNPPVVRIAELV